MTRGRPRFAAFLAASLLLHIAAASVLRAGIGAAEGARDEMVIDLTGSFRTGPARRVAPPPVPASAVEPAANPAVLEAAPSRDAMLSQGPGEDGDAGDPAAPLVGITALPELKGRGALRGRLERWYPSNARSAGVEGIVTLEVVVSSRGRIAFAIVIRSDPPAFAAEFAAAALGVARELEFTPAYLGARPAAVRIRLPVRFEIER